MGPEIRAAKSDKHGEVSGDELTSVMSALEPDQLISSKEKHHCPRRKLTGGESVLFWALRVYLVFMLGVVVYQIWTAAPR